MRTVADDTDSDGAIRKVRGLMALAAPSSGAPEPEREAALSKAVELRLKYGISDADLVDEPSDDFMLMGRRLFVYGNHVKPHLDKIEKEINAALDVIEKDDDPSERAQWICQFYRDVQDRLEGTRWTRGSVKERRDAAVKAYYTAEKARYAENMTEWLGPEDDYNRTLYLHNHARDYTAMYTELRKDTVENIVGVHERKIWERILRAQVCDICGLDGNGKRAYVEWDREREIHHHPTCVSRGEPDLIVKRVGD